MTQQNTSLEIRNARPDELDRVATLLQDAYRQFEPNMPAEMWRVYLQDIIDVRSRLAASSLIVALVDGQLAGAVTLYIDMEFSKAEGWPDGWAGIRLLAVNPVYRGRGIGRALMDECVRRCRERGIKTIGLHTNEMMSVALAMYTRMGFKRVPDFDFHPTPEITAKAFRLDMD